MALSFAFDASKETPESVKRRRAIAEALAQSVLGRHPRDVGEGLSTIGNALAFRALQAKNAKAEGAGRSSANDIFSSLFAGFPDAPAAPGSGGSFSAAPAQPDDPNVGSTIDFARAEGARSTVPEAGAIREGLIARGLPEHVADAFVLNFQDESGLKTDINEAAPIVPGSRGGFGLSQWTGPRRVALEKFATERGTPTSDLDTQLDFLMYELEGPEAAAAEKILAAKDTPTAATAILNDFLRPAEEHRARREAKYLGAGAPVQVASADPSIGLPPADPAAGVFQAGAEQGLPADNPGLQALAALAAQEGTAAAPLPQPGAPIAPAAPAAPVAPGGPPMPPPTAANRVAQAVVGELPEMAGNRRATPGSPDIQRLMNAMGNEWLSEGQKRVLGALLEQEMQKADPAYGLQLQKARLDMEKQALELELLRNPQMSPYERAQIDLRQRQLDAESKKLLEISEGTTVFDPVSRKPVYTAPKDEEAPTVQTFFGDDGREYKAQWVNGEWVPIGGAKAPSGFAIRSTPDGGFEMVQGGAKLTENQSKLTLFQTLQTETQPVLLDLESQWDPANVSDAAARSTPIAGNFFKSEQGQIYDAAATAWAEGALRIATGAAATPEEMERTKKAYFAQVGDTPNTVAFKAQMREMYNRAIQRALGNTEVKGALPKPSEFAKAVDEQTAAPAAPAVEPAAVPEGIDPEDWKFMSPEERLLFQ